MPNRSPVTDTYQQAEQFVQQQLNALPQDVLMVVLDMISPLPEQPEAPAKKTRKKRKPSTTASSSAAKKRGLPDAPPQADQSDLTTCAECPYGPDDNIHHKRSVEGYHEFKEAA